MFSWSSSAKVEQRYREDGKITLAIVVVVARLIRDDESSRRVNGIVIVACLVFLSVTVFFLTLLRFCGENKRVITRERHTCLLRTTMVPPISRRQKKRC